VASDDPVELPLERFWLPSLLRRAGGEELAYKSAPWSRLGLWRLLLLLLLAVEEDSEEATFDVAEVSPSSEPLESVSSSFSSGASLSSAPLGFCPFFFSFFFILWRFSSSAGRSGHAITLPAPPPADPEVVVALFAFGELPLWVWMGAGAPIWSWGRSSRSIGGGLKEKGRQRGAQKVVLCSGKSCRNWNKGLSRRFGRWLLLF
jgi:hypothetical protein